MAPPLRVGQPKHEPSRCLPWYAPAPLKCFSSFLLTVHHPGSLFTAVRLRVSLLLFLPVSLAISLSLNRWIFPVAVFSTSSTHMLHRGYLYGASRFLTNAFSSLSRAGLGAFPRPSTTNASGLTSSSLPSAPTTPASTTAGCS